jgi:hypothetical protein
MFHVRIRSRPNLFAGIRTTGTGSESKYSGLHKRPYVVITLGVNVINIKEIHRNSLCDSWISFGGCTYFNYKKWRQKLGWGRHERWNPDQSNTRPDPQHFWVANLTDVHRHMELVMKKLYPSKPRCVSLFYPYNTYTNYLIPFNGVFLQLFCVFSSFIL